MNFDKFTMWSYTSSGYKYLCIRYLSRCHHTKKHLVLPDNVVSLNGQDCYLRIVSVCQCSRFPAGYADDLLILQRPGKLGLTADHSSLSITDLCRTGF